jgi:hypothetical protein
MISLSIGFTDMVWYVNRVDGKIVTACPGFVAGMAEDGPIAEDDIELLAFLNPSIYTPPITKRQLRLTLVRHGIPISSISSAINEMPDGIEKEEALIEWEDASYYRREHPTLLYIMNVLSLSESQVDAMWEEALNS